MMRVVCVVYLTFVTDVCASVGDRLPYFRECVSNYYVRNPDNDFKDASYECMWRTVHYLQHYDVKIPQFYGRVMYQFLYYNSLKVNIFFSFR